MNEYTDGMSEYVVSLIEPIDNDGTNIETYSFAFECWAEDITHAIEQAENAYPYAVVIDVDLV
jgi:hypothetical protein